MILKESTEMIGKMCSKQGRGNDMPTTDDPYIASLKNEIKGTAEINMNLLASCKALLKHAKACRATVAEPDKDYYRELSKMITEADAAIQDK